MYWFFCCGTKPRTTLETRAAEAIRMLESQKSVIMQSHQRYQIHADELKAEALRLWSVQRVNEARMKVTEYRRNQQNSEIYLREWKSIDAQIAQVQCILAVNDALTLKEGAIPKLEELGVTLNEPEELSSDGDNNDSEGDEGASLKRKPRVRSPLAEDVRFKLVRENLEKFNSTVDKIQSNRNLMNPAERGAETSADAFVPQDRDPDLELLWQWENGINLVPKNDNLSPRQLLMSAADDHDDSGRPDSGLFEGRPHSDRSVDGSVPSGSKGGVNVLFHESGTGRMSGEEHSDVSNV